jgi:hypothetical protein
MNLHERIDNDTILYYVSDYSSTYNEEDDTDTTDVYELSFGFYDCSYLVYVKRDDILTDTPWMTMEGDSKLFESFESRCEDELWDFIKDKCKEFDEWILELDAE